MPSTARGMLPQAVMRITGTEGRKILIWRSRCSPSCPVVTREKFISRIISSGEAARTISIASPGDEASRVS